MPDDKPSANTSRYSTPASPARKIILLVLFCVAQFLDAFNISALFSAIPVMSEDLHLSPTESTWLVSAYQLTFAAFLLCSGRISDLYNPKFCFIVGIGGLGVFSILAGVMQNKIALLVMRAISGIAAALTIPSSLTLLVRLFPGQPEQARAIGVFGGSSALGTVLGLIIGALFVEYVNWHWVFYLAGIVAFPIGILCTFLVPKQPSPRDDLSQRRLSHLDLPGITILTSAIILFNFALTSSGTEGWKSPMVLAPLVVSILLIATFFVWEAHCDERYAAFPPKTWRYRNFAILFAIALSVFFWFTNVFLIKVQLWQDVYNWSAIKSAVHFLPIGLVAGPLTILAYPICAKFEFKWTLLIAQGLLIVSNAIMPFADENTAVSYWRYDFPAMVTGAAGGALLFVTANVAIFHNTPREISGTVGAIFNCALQLGAAVGSAVLTSIVAGVGDDSEVYAGRAAAFWFLFALMVVEAAAVLVFYHPDDRLQHAPPDTNVEMLKKRSSDEGVGPADVASDKYTDRKDTQV